MEKTYERLMDKLIARYNGYIIEMCRCEEKIKFEPDYALIQRYRTQMCQAGQAAEIIAAVIMAEVGPDEMKRLYDAAREFAQNC